jgi:hypothetical protein
VLYTYDILPLKTRHDKNKTRQSNTTQHRARQGNTTQDNTREDNTTQRKRSLSTLFFFFHVQNLPQVKEIQLRGSGIYFVGCHQISTWASDCSALQKVRFCLENNEDSNEGTVFVIESRASKKSGGNTRALRQFEYAASKLQAIFRGNTTRFCDYPA